MPPFKDDQIIIIQPGSQTTLAQLGLPESFTPARLRIKSRMFPGEAEGQWESYKVRRRDGKRVGKEEAAETNEMAKSLGESEEEIIYEEDHVTDEGAVWPMTEGRITNWACFYALIEHVYNALSPPFHTPILLIAQPAWTPKEHEKLAQFFFEKFKMPAFALVDSAVATAWAYGVPTATVIDVGLGKADVTAVEDFQIHDTGRSIAVPKCGGEAMTQRLLELLITKGFSREMCEQLKRSPICEILPPDIPIPGTTDVEVEKVTNPAAAASTGATGSGPGHRINPGAMGDAPLGPGPDTEVGDEGGEEEDNEGVLDVASIVAGGKMNEFLARKEKEKTEKAQSKKKGAPDTAQAAARASKLVNSKRERNTFLFEDHETLDVLKNSKLSGQQMADAQRALDETKNGEAHTNGVEDGNAPASIAAANARGPIRREVEVGVERLRAASGGIIEMIADSMHRTVSAVEEVAKRSELWNSLILVGNGAKVRGFREALQHTLQAKYVISPSSATIFTSELPSNLSTPADTGMNTPQPQLGPHGGSSHVNPLLLAATTAQNPHLQPGNLQPTHSHTTHSSHGQTPSSIKFVDVPGYFPEWKEVGYDEATFLGAQVAARVLFVQDQGLSKGFMSRSDYNEQGPMGIHDYSM